MFSKGRKGRPMVDPQLAQIAALRARIKKLRAALDRIGRHDYIMKQDWGHIDGVISERLRWAREALAADDAESKLERGAE